MGPTGSTNFKGLLLSQITFELFQTSSDFILNGSQNVVVFLFVCLYGFFFFFKFEFEVHHCNIQGNPKLQLYQKGSHRRAKLSAIWSSQSGVRGISMFNGT